MVGAISTHSGNTLCNDRVGDLSVKQLFQESLEFSYNPEGKFQELENKFVNSCSDGQDDGKLSGGEKFSAILLGATNHFLEEVRNTKKLIKEHPVETILASAATVVAFICVMSTPIAPFVATALTIFGVVKGLIGMIKSVKEIISSCKESKNAKTDTEAKQIFSNIGDSGAGFVENAILTVMSGKGLKGSLNKTTFSQNCKKMHSMADKDIIENASDLVNGKNDIFDKDVFDEFMDKTNTIANTLVQSSEEPFGLMKDVTLFVSSPLLASLNYMRKSSAN